MTDLPKSFADVGEVAIASYDWTDLVSGLGYSTFFGLVSVDSAATTHNLVSQSAYSMLIETARTSIGTTTMNFETSTFNLPRIASGIAYFSAGIAANGTNDMHIEVQLKKVLTDGSTTADLSSNINSADYTSSKRIVLFLKIPITETNIRKGEKLRMVVKLVAESTDACAIGHDPKNRDGTYITPSSAPITSATIMTLYMPFKIDL